MTKLKILSEKSNKIISKLEYSNIGSDPMISLKGITRKLNDAIGTINELVDVVNESTTIIDEQDQHIEKLKKVIKNLEHDHEQRIEKLEADYKMRNIKF